VTASDHVDLLRTRRTGGGRLTGARPDVGNGEDTRVAGPADTTYISPLARPAENAFEVRGVEPPGRTTGTAGRSVRSAGLAIESYDCDGWAVLMADGELDVYTAPSLRARFSEIISQGRTHLLVDFSTVSFVDAAGLGSLVGALGATRAAGGTLRLVGQASLGRLLEITLLHEALPLFSSLEAAAAHEETSAEHR
jgi:anti-anti-sigma factor